MNWKKLTGILLTGAMALTMGAFGAAYAEDTYTQASNAGNFAATQGVAPTDVTLVKNLVMDRNLVTPDATFTFHFAQSKVDGAAYSAATNPMPAIADQSVTTGAADAGTADAVNPDKKLVAKTVAGFVPAAANFPHAGVYEYIVTETAPAAPVSGIQYSGASYVMRVYVENGTTAGALTVVGVTVEKTKVDAGTALTPAAKVDASAAGKGFAFENDYTKTSPLDIQKTVLGAYGDKTKQFAFAVTLNLPTTNRTMTKATAEVWKDGAKVTRMPSTYDFTFTNGTSTANVALADGEYLHFYDNGTAKNALPVGTTYSLVETGAAGYQPTANVTYSGKTADQQNAVAAGTAGTDYTVNLTNTDVTRTTTVGEGANNKTVVTNTYKDITPTGIIIDNLPYLLMIAVAVGGFAAYLCAKMRKNGRAAR